MKRQKEYSTLKVQQEMLKAMFKTVATVGPNSILDVKDFSVFSDEECINWVTYKGIAIYRLENQAIGLNRLPFLCIGDILTALNEYNKKLEFKCFRVDEQNRLIALFEADDVIHKIDNRLMDLVNINTQDYTFYTSSNKKDIIIAVRDAENRLLAGIMEVK